MGDTTLSSLALNGAASVSRVADGAFDIKITNRHASTADTGAPVINFVVIKAV